jgi:Mg2+-importing ATPase
VIVVVVAGLCLPFLPIAGWIGLAPLPAAYFGWLMLILAAYLVAAQLLKNRWVRRAELFP